MANAVRTATTWTVVTTIAATPASALTASRSVLLRLKRASDAVDRDHPAVVDPVAAERVELRCDTANEERVGRLEAGPGSEEVPGETVEALQATVDDDVGDPVRVQLVHLVRREERSLQDL